MAAPKIRKAKGNEETAKLLAALNVVSRAQDKNGSVAEQHCRIKSGWLIASNSKLSIGVKCETTFECNPNTDKLMTALSKTGDQVSFAADEKGHTLLVKSGRFRVTIGALADEWLPTIVPDVPVGKINGKLLEAMKVCAAVADETQDHPMFKGVWIDGYSCAASDRKSIIQFWHGIDLPRGVIVPKFAVKALTEHDSELTELGFSGNTMTFYYADGSFVQTVLYDCKYPEYTRVLDQQYNYMPIPTEFFNGLHAILDFSDDKTIYFHAGKLTTTYEDNDKGAVYEVPGISKGRIFNGELLKLLEKYATKVDFYGEAGAAFVGNQCRGIISRRS